MKRVQILVCDDETHLREMVAEYLTDRDFCVLQAEGPDELRAHLQYETPDLILLDIRMPGEDGLTALRTLRATHDIPVIMLTATSGTIDRVVGLELGADDYLGKPVDLRELEARIKAVPRRHSACRHPKLATNHAVKIFGLGSLWPLWPSLGRRTAH